MGLGQGFRWLGRLGVSDRSVPSTAAARFGPSPVGDPAPPREWPQMHSTVRAPPSLSRGGAAGSSSGRGHPRSRCTGGRAFLGRLPGARRRATGRASPSPWPGGAGPRPHVGGAVGRWSLLGRRGVRREASRRRRGPGRPWLSPSGRDPGPGSKNARARRHRPCRRGSWCPGAPRPEIAPRQCVNESRPPNPRDGSQSFPHARTSSS